MDVVAFMIRDISIKAFVGGQQQNVARARLNPALLLCDEPTGTLDSKTSKQVLKLIEDVNRIVRHGNDDYIILK